MYLCISEVCSSLLLSNITLYECALTFSVISSVDRHLSKFQFGTIMNKSTIHILIKVFCVNIFSFR